MSLDKAILEVVEAKLKDGSIEKLVEAKITEGIENALERAFSSYGDVTKVVEGKIKEVIVPYLENYDYSEYVTKVDHVLVDILKQTAVPHKQILENFKDLATFNAPEKMTVTQIFEKWKKCVAHNIETDDLEICYEDEPSYYDVEVTATVEDGDKPDWLRREEKTILLECEKDEKMNFAVKLYRYTDISLEWKIDYRDEHSLRSLRYLNEFEVFLMQLNQMATKVEVDTEYIDDEVEVDAKPEPEWN